MSKNEKSNHISTVAEHACDATNLRMGNKIHQLETQLGYELLSKGDFHHSKCESLDASSKPLTATAL